MRYVWKFPLQIIDRQIILAPSVFDVVYAGLDPNGTPCIWAEVCFIEEKSKHVIFIVGTGHEIPALATRHIGSFVQGQFVWHVYM